MTIWAAAFANRLQERLTGMNLLSQREQAESGLRAKMFGDLLGPIAGQPGDKPLDSDRELLLAELLALNFHEHFEFKPLLLRVDERLAEESAGAAGPSPLARKRHELRSIARRVSGRQIASLLAEGDNGATSERAALWPVGSGRSRGAAGVALLRFHGDLPESLSLDRADKSLTDQYEGAGLVVRSPDGTDSLMVIAHDPDWINETIKLDVRVWERGQGHDPTSGADFTLTWFDFPLTDNTLLKDGNRFSFVLRDVQTEAGGVFTVGLVWFPRGYFTPRERPVNHRDLQKLIGKRVG